MAVMKVLEIYCGPRRWATRFHRLSDRRAYQRRCRRSSNLIYIRWPKSALIIGWRRRATVWHGSAQTVRRRPRPSTRYASAAGEAHVLDPVAIRCPIDALSGACGASVGRERAQYGLKTIGMAQAVAPPREGERLEGIRARAIRGAVTASATGADAGCRDPRCRGSVTVLSWERATSRRSASAAFIRRQGGLSCREVLRCGAVQSDRISGFGSARKGEDGDGGRWGTGVQAAAR
ncbi:hypothetical protein C8J57DRAFT_182925 [Mycena rebaudengoi]|nr:hypothetical protein C8J57DRAFT_182925 [Mycena rebaudengoi]